MRTFLRMNILVFLSFLILSCAGFLQLFTEEEPAAKTPIQPGKTASASEQTDTSSTPRLENMNKGAVPADVSAYRKSAPQPVIKTVPQAIQKNVFSQPDDYLDKLVRHLVKDEKNPFLQVKVIHDWIADNISYDTDAFFSGNCGDTSYAGTLKNKKSVCDGYASLFLEMCTRAGITCEKISGYARGYGFSPFGTENFSDSNHAWNAVFLNECWYLVDVTWDAGNVSGKQFERSYSTKYLFLEPEYMIYTHVPENPSWQLMNTILSPAALSALPQYRGEYFQAGLKPIPELTKTLRTDETLEISFPAPRGTNFRTAVYSTDGKNVEQYCFTQTDGQTVHILARFPEPGEWLLRLFAGRGSGSYDFCLELGVSASRGTNIVFPTAYSPFFEDGLFLISPLANPLKAGETIDFRLRAPGYQIVCLIADSEIIPLKQIEDGTFTGKMVIPKASKFGLYGSKSKSSSYTGLIGYTVLP